MGLFTRKKKQSKANAVATAAAAETKAKADAEATIVAAAARDVTEKRKLEDSRKVEEQNHDNIIAKRKQIEQLQRALRGFEEQRQREAKLALRARDMKKSVDMKSHMRQVSRLKARISQYENMISRNMDQLGALEDMATNKQQMEMNKQFTDNMKLSKLDVDEIDDTLQEAHEAQKNVDEINRLFQADANLNPASTEMMDMEAELDALESEFIDDATTAIPALPSDKPVLPKVAAPAGPSAISTEEDDIRRLEEEVAL